MRPFMRALEAIKQTIQRSFLRMALISIKQTLFNRASVLVRGLFGSPSVLLGLLFGSLSAFGGVSDSLPSLLQNPPGRFARLNIGGPVIYDTAELKLLYQKNNYQPYWISEGQVTGRLRHAKNTLLKAEDHGFDGERYWNAEFDAYLSGAGSLSDLEFELGVSEALLRFAKHLYRGQIDPNLLDSDIDLKNKVFSSKEVNQLAEGLIRTPTQLDEIMAGFEPTMPLYHSLKNILRNHAGELTQKEFNKVALSMEKLRWLPRQLGDRYAFVNLAATELSMVENRKVIFRMGTVNGRPLRRTPTMSDLIKTVELNPSWTVPLNLVIWDKLPKIRKDPTILTENGFRVFDKSMTQMIDDVTRIDWDSLNRKNFPYIIQQKPGPDNALGKVKFPLTNKHFVYLHDSNERELFAKEGPRLFSSGCIRLENPMDFAAYLLQEQRVPKASAWIDERGHTYPEGTRFTKEILENYIQQSYQQESSIRTLSLNIEKPLPLYTMFLTADIDESNGVRFHGDAYQQDARLLDILVNGGGSGRLDSRSHYIEGDGRQVSFTLQGELGPTQLFGVGTMIRCSVKPYKGCVDAEAKGIEEREEFPVRINRPMLVPEGYYLLGFENSRYPGWFHVKCEPLDEGECAPQVLSLKKIFLSEKISQASVVVVTRDISQDIEQNKFLADQFYNGHSLFKEAAYGTWGFYLPGVNQFDVVQRLKNDFCFKLDRNEKDISPEVLDYCLSLRDGLTLEQFENLPVAASLFNAEGTNDQVDALRSLKLFNFKMKPTNQSPLGEWTQSWITKPGAWLEFPQRPYLVASPLFPQNLSREKQFVSVLPGAYKITGLNEKGAVMIEEFIQVR